MTYAKEFQARIDSIDARAKKAGTSITELCRRAKVARSTPDRWRKIVPMTVVIITKLEDELADIEAARHSVIPACRRHGASCACGREFEYCGLPYTRD